MNNKPILTKIRVIILQEGPLGTGELRDLYLQDMDIKRLNDLLEDCWYVTKDDSNRWHLTNHATDKNKLDYYPPDEEPLRDDDEFFSDLADLIEEHESSEEERYRFFCACVYFGESWKTEPGSW